MIAIILVFIVAIFAIIYVNIPKCSNEGETCTTYRKCCGGLTCIEGKCKTTGGDASTCSTIGKKCLTNPCCSGFYCDPKTKTCLEDSCKTVFSPTLSVSYNSDYPTSGSFKPFVKRTKSDGIVERISINKPKKIIDLFCDRPTLYLESLWDGMWPQPVSRCMGSSTSYCSTLSVADESKDTCRFVDSNTLEFMDKTDTANCKIIFNASK